MNKLFQARAEIASHVKQFRSKVEKSLKAGKIPADYSLGFINALIWSDHRVNGRGGEPKFFDRTGSIGALPKPVCLLTDNATKNTDLYLFLREEVILRAKQVIEKCKFDDKESTVDISDDAVNGLLNLRKTLESIDNFVRDHEEMLRLHAQTAESQPDDDAKSEVLQTNSTVS